MSNLTNSRWSDAEVTNASCINLRSEVRIVHVTVALPEFALMRQLHEALSKIPIRLPASFRANAKFDLVP